MKYWQKYIIVVAILIAVLAFIKFVPFWVTLVLLGVGVGTHLTYRDIMCKDIIK